MKTDDKKPKGLLVPFTASVREKTEVEKLTEDREFYKSQLQKVMSINESLLNIERTYIERERSFMNMILGQSISRSAMS